MKSYRLGQGLWLASSLILAASCLQKREMDHQITKMAKEQNAPDPRAMVELTYYDISQERAQNDRADLPGKKIVLPLQASPDFVSAPPAEQGENLSLFEPFLQAYQISEVKILPDLTLASLHQEQELAAGCYSFAEDQVLNKLLLAREPHAQIEELLESMPHQAAISFSGYLCIDEGRKITAINNFSNTCSLIDCNTNLPILLARFGLTWQDQREDPALPLAPLGALKKVAAKTTDDIIPTSLAKLDNRAVQKNIRLNPRFEQNSWRLLKRLDQDDSFIQGRIQVQSVIRAADDNNINYIPARSLSSKKGVSVEVLMTRPGRSFQPLPPQGLSPEFVRVRRMVWDFKKHLQMKAKTDGLTSKELIAELVKGGEFESVRTISDGQVTMAKASYRFQQKPLGTGAGSNVYRATLIDSDGHEFDIAMRAPNISEADRARKIRIQESAAFIKRDQAKTPAELSKVEAEILREQFKRDFPSNNILLISEEFNGHPNFLSYYGRVDDYDFFQIGRSDLESYVKKNVSDHDLDNMPADEIVPAMLEALSVLHATGKTHFDIKPANFLFVRSGAGYKVAMIDLDTAKVTPQLVKSYPVLPFSVMYLSPERALGYLGKTVDFGGRFSLQKSDVWSLAVSALEIEHRSGMYEMLMATLREPNVKKNFPHLDNLIPQGKQGAAAVREFSDNLVKLLSDEVFYSTFISKFVSPLKHAEAYKKALTFNPRQRISAEEFKRLWLEN